MSCVKLGGTADLTNKFVPADELPGFFYESVDLADQARGGQQDE